MLGELNLSTPARFVFLQETDSSVDAKKKKKKKKKMERFFTDNCFFSHDKTNLCGVAIGYYGKKVFQTSEQIY